MLHSKLVSYDDESFIIRKNGIKHTFKYEDIHFINEVGLPRYENQFLYKEDREALYSFYEKGTINNEKKLFSLRTSDEVEKFIEKCKEKVISFIDE